MRLLYLHGYGAQGGGFKAKHLSEAGYDVACPLLPDDDFVAAVEIARQALAEHRPEVIVGSSRGGAVAMQLARGQTPLVLIAPAWMRWGSTQRVSDPVLVLHSEHDELIPLDFSRQLLASSGLPDARLWVVGAAHPLTDPAGLAALVRAIESFGASG